MFNKLKIIFATMLFSMTCSITFAETNLPMPIATGATQRHSHQSSEFNYNTINTVLWPIVTHYTAFPDIPEWYANSAKPPLPLPSHTKFLAKALTLRDAIWIALRNDPNVKNDEVQRIEDKFALAVARWNFEPQFTDDFQYTRDFATGQTTTTTSGSVSLNTPIATNITTGFSNDTYTTTITQPFMNGGWLTPWNNYLNAVNAEKLSKLTFKSSIISIVTNVISSYTALVDAYNSLAINRENLKQTEVELKQDKLKLKTGRMARSDVLQEEVNLQTDKLGVVQEEDSVQSSYQSFLNLLGLVATARIRVDQDIDITGFAEPDLQTCIATALRHNTTYLGDKLAVEDAKRNLTNAINNLMPTVTATGTFVSGGDQNSRALGIEVSVPIDDMPARQEKLTAKIALEQAKITLAQERQTITNDVTSQWKTVQADIQQIKIGENQVMMQQQVVRNSNLSLQYGRSTMFDYLQERNNLQSNQQTLVSNKITYINDVATLDSTMGITLRRWNIKLRY